jgi:hypothetical protein
VRTFLTVILLGLSAGTQAAAVTIDFTDPSIPSGGAGYDDFVTEGYLFSFDPMPSPDPYFTASPGIVYCPGCVLNMESASSNTFDVSSFDGLVFGASEGEGLFEVTGFLEGGGTVSATFASFLGLTQTYNLNWTGLTRLSIGNINGTPTVVKSITASQVPVPAAVWLFASGLGLLGWFRRRHTA